MDAKTHGIIHKVVGISNTGKDLSDFLLFVFVVDLLEPKVDLVFVLRKHPELPHFKDCVWFEQNVFTFAKHYCIII